ncbi:hypothetical protein A176_000442 [Myxococcus hansupus]|uniref:Uncharacterized protein n=1 Tax=Pseudomyxococcus hansupus TaxID=1297742 RepID=A0A0H4WQE4_9BACT|nr:double-CXXCG motif protein [Myxococcus hansupus]AKQ63530.1 hypothetical protein A176_000442 [Myxococcus hansupus]
MPRYFWLLEDWTALAAYKGDFNAAHKWGLPGLAKCPGCGATWASTGHNYPAVDLSALPEQHEFLKARPEPFAEFMRLQALVRPLAPPGVALPPGTLFGPLVGTARGDLGPLTWQGSYLLLLRRDAFEALQAEGVLDPASRKAELRFRQKAAPEYLEPQVELRGQLHSDCYPPDQRPPCTTCGRFGMTLPDDPILDAASLPTDRDLFRVGNFATVLIGTERFKDAVQRLGLEGIAFREIPTR